MSSASILNEGIALSENLTSELALLSYVGSVCENLEANGYEISEEFALDWFVSELTSLSESTELDEDFRKFLKRAAGAVSGAAANVAGKVIPKTIHVKRAKQAYKQMGNINDKLTKEEPTKADRAEFFKHAAKHDYHLKHSNPDEWKNLRASVDRNTKDPVSGVAARQWTMAKQTGMVWRKKRALADIQKKSAEQFSRSQERTPIQKSMQ